MEEIKDLNLKEFLTQAVNEVFNTMLSMEMKHSDAEPQATLDGERIVGSVSFAGELMGTFSIHATKDFASIMTAAMLGMEVDEIEDDEEVNDVIGEVSNMIGGSLKSRFCDSGMPCELSIPSITSGNDFTISSMNWEKHESLVFRHQDHIALVEVSMKSGN